ncbi:hypothetical protein BDZ89DRAFT_1130578 [Hymenopellis radicata]|nr:hypothetical protein BDZ89DRAFT_1130578 [Hymenopellis radicata]
MSRGQSYSHVSRKTARDSEGSISTLNDDSRRPKRIASSSQTTHNLTRLVALILHLLALILHIVLLGIWSKHVEHNITVPLGDATSRASVGVVVVLQAFGILFSTLMVLSVQSLSAKTIVQKDVTITALHDTGSAWSGLGSAALALSRQFSLPAAWWPTFNATTPTSVTTHGLPDYGLADRNLSDYFTMELASKRPSDVVSLLRSLSQATTPGLSLADGILYSLPDANRGSGNMNTSATFFNVSCGLAPDGVVEPVDDSAFGDTGYSVRADGDDLIINGLTVYWMSPYSLRTTPALTKGLFSETINFFIVAPDVSPFVDSAGKAVSIFPLTNGSISLDRIQNHIEIRYNITGFQILSCSLELQPRTATIDTQTLVLRSLDRPTVKDSSSWAVTQRTGNRTQYDPKNETDALLSHWTDFTSSSFSSTLLSASQHNSNGQLSDESLVYYTLTEIYLMNSLKLYPENSNQGAFRNASSNATLHELENAISGLVAGAVWADMNLKTDNITDQNVQAFSRDRGPTTQVLAQASVDVISQSSRLNLNLLPIILGLVSTIMLLILAGEIIWAARQASELDGLGGLHLLWLTSNNADVHRTMGSVGEPTMANLRSAGMAKALER